MGPHDLLANPPFPGRHSDRGRTVASPPSWSHKTEPDLTVVSDPLTKDVLASGRADNFQPVRIAADSVACTQHLHPLDHKAIARVKDETKRNVTRPISDRDTGTHHFNVPNVSEYLPFIPADKEARCRVPGD